MHRALIHFCKKHLGNEQLVGTGARQALIRPTACAPALSTELLHNDTHILGAGCVGHIGAQACL